MYCVNCGNKISDDSKFCEKCGAKIGNNIVKENSENHTSEVVPNETKPLSSYEFLHIPVDRLIWASILSFGFYRIYWFCENWSAIRKVTGEKMMPFWRGVFSVFWSGEPFELPLKKAKEAGYKLSYNPKLLSGFYLLAGIGYNIALRADLDLSYYLLLAIIGELIVLAPVIKAQTVTNWSAGNEGRPYKKLGLPEFGIIVLAWGLVLLIALGSS